MAEILASYETDPPDRHRHGVVHFAKLVLAFAGAFIGYMLLIAVFESRMLPRANLEITGFSLAETDKIHRHLLADHNFTKIADQNFSYKVGKPASYAVLRKTYSRESLSGDHQSILITRARDKVSVMINGKPIGFETAETSVDTTAMGPRLYNIPENYLQDGENVIDIYLYGHHWPPRLFKAFVGPRNDLIPAFSWRKFLTVDGINVLSGIGLFMALFTFSVGLASREQRAEYLSMGFIMLFWVGRNFYYTIHMYDWPLAWQSLFFNVTTFGMVMSVAAFANAWGKGSRKFYRIYALLVVLYALSAFALDQIDLRLGDAMYMFVGLPLIAGVILWSVYQQIRMFGRRDFSIPAMVNLGICTAAVTADMMGEILLSSPGSTAPLVTTLPYTPLAIIFVATGLVYSLVYRTIRLQQAEKEQRKELARELAIKSKALEESYARTREQEKSAAISAERQRIMQDMHDGIGSQLLGLQLQIRQNSLSPEEVSAELKNSLNDLRLIVDSLDTEANDISLALGAFRARVQPQLSAADVELEWKMDIPGTVSGFGPESVLHIYRIMQEAVTNALRHSSLTKMSISMRRDKAANTPDGENDYLTIRVMDNGGGFDEEQILAGRGLKNMRRRAEMLNGTLDIQRLAEGLSVFLRVPVRPAA